LNNCLPWDTVATDAEGRKTAPATGTQVVRRLIVVMLLTAAAPDLTRCGLVMAAARYPAPTAGLVTAGLAAATLTARTTRGCRHYRPRASQQLGRQVAGFVLHHLRSASADAR
jgi:hypothetical protein